MNKTKIHLAVISEDYKIPNFSKMHYALLEKNTFTQIGLTLPYVLISSTPEKYEMTSFWDTV
jgi:hypothetical protein